MWADVVPNLLHSPILLDLNAVSYAELSALPGPIESVELFFFFMPGMRVIIKDTRTSAASNDNFKGSLGVVQLTFNF